MVEHVAGQGTAHNFDSVDFVAVQTAAQQYGGSFLGAVKHVHGKGDFHPRGQTGNGQQHHLVGASRDHHLIQYQGLAFGHCPKYVSGRRARNSAFTESETASPAMNSTKEASVMWAWVRVRSLRASYGLG